MEMIRKKISFYDWTPELIPAFVYKGNNEQFLYARLSTYNWFSQFISEEDFDHIDWNVITLPIEKTITRDLSNFSDFTPVLEHIDLTHFDFKNTFVVSDIIRIFSFFSFINNAISLDERKSFGEVYTEAKGTYHFKALKPETKRYIANFCAANLASSEERYNIISSLE